jgi:quercetin dioxygenase-like cupin family protein
MTSISSYTLRVVFIGLLAGAYMASQAAESAAGPLASRVFTWKSLEARPSAVGQRRNIVNQRTATLQRFQSHATTLNPGVASHPPHQHPLEEMILVREGTLEVTINGRGERAGPGSVLFYASNDFHSVRNIGDKPATYIVLNFGTRATDTAPSQRAVESAPPEKLKSQVFEWSALQVKPTKTGARRDVFNSATVTCKNLSCHVTSVHAQQASHGAHRHVDEEVVVVKEGLIEVLINGSTYQAGPGSVCFFASNDEHGMRNIGDTPATYYVIRVISESTPAPPAKKS